jgi:hypothetical protein
MSLEFTPEHEKNYTELSTAVAVALPEMKGKDLVSNCTEKGKDLVSTAQRQRSGVD